MLMLLACVDVSAARPQGPPALLPHTPSPAPGPKLDEMWLRQPLVGSQALRRTYRSQLGRAVDIHAEAPVVADPVARAQLYTVVEELSGGLRRLLGANVTTSCCTHNRSSRRSNTAGRLTVEVSAAHVASLGMEGFDLSSTDNAVVMRAATASGALYGAFRLLSYVQRALPLPSQTQEAPDMELRIWDLWDDLSGDVTRGFAGDSLIWPQAMWIDPNTDDGPAPTKLFVAPCNGTDPMQHWEGSALTRPGAVSRLANGNGQCLSTSSGLTVVPCSSISPDRANSSRFWLNTTSDQISVGPLVRGVGGAGRRCFDINHGAGPDVGTYHCHPLYPGGGGERDYANQQWRIQPLAGSWVQLAAKGLLAQGQCLTLRNSFPPSPAAPKGISWSDRLVQLMRLLKSSGMNGMVLNDVNACYGDNGQLLYPDVLTNISSNLARTMARFGITPYMSVCFGSPTVMANITSDPKSQITQKWWRDKAREIWGKWPTFGGFLVKADSEGNIGPLRYNRTEADGANLLVRTFLCIFVRFDDRRCWLLSCVAVDSCSPDDFLGPCCPSRLALLHRTRASLCGERSSTATAILVRRSSSSSPIPRSCHWTENLTPTSCYKSRTDLWTSRSGISIFMLAASPASITAC